LAKIQIFYFYFQKNQTFLSYFVFLQCFAPNNSCIVIPTFASSAIVHNKSGGVEIKFNQPWLFGRRSLFNEPESERARVLRAIGQILIKAA
jgi:hypothetical protein